MAQPKLGWRRHPHIDGARLVEVLKGRTIKEARVTIDDDSVVGMERLFLTLDDDSVVEMSPIPHSPYNPPGDNLMGDESGPPY